MTWTLRRAISAALAAMAALAACSSGDGGTTPTPPTPPKVAVGSVEVSPTTNAMAPGDTVRLTAAVKDTKGAVLTGRTVTWGSSAETVASVASSGLVTAVAAGSATITASVEGVTGTAKVTVSSAIPGQPGDPAVGNITRMPFVQVDSEYKGGHPLLGSMPVSVRTVMVVIKPAATVADLSGMLKQVGATMAGALPGVAGEAPATLALRLPTETHTQLEEALAVLRAHPAVLVAGRDVVLREDVITNLKGMQIDWVWDPSAWRVPDLATWALRAIRMPQAWNLNPQIRARGDVRLRTGVLDLPVDATHPDLKSSVVRKLTSEVTCTVTPQRDCAHGMHVAGIIGAGYNDTVGIDGVNPFANLVTRATQSASSVAASLWGLDDLIQEGASLRVINVSLGYNWGANGGGDPRVANGPAQQQAETDGRIVAERLQTLIRAGYAVPFIAASAGNDGTAYPGVQARFNSPYTNAALSHGVAIIAAVESDQVSGLAISPSYAVSSFSDVGGHLSAPGDVILSTVLNGGYGRKSGTSMAAPHVAGVAGFLFALLPDVRAADMRKALVAGTAHPAGPPFNGRPMLDAFATALELDVITGQERVLPMLLDIDDGTEDGNQRIDPFTGAIDTTERVMADATIDMSDFRRWRDWLLAVENDAGLRLDGAATHPKRDVNADGLVGANVKEDLFPQGDFNGDGLLSGVLPAVVPGVLRSRGPLTDLQVLQARFSDPHYSAAELDSLIDSGDLHLDLKNCQALPGVASIEVDIRDSVGSTLRQRRPVALTAGRQIFTVPVSPQQKTRVQVKVTPSAGLATTKDTTFVIAPGADVAWTPECATLAITLPALGTTGAVVQGYPAPWIRVTDTYRKLDLQVNFNGNDYSEIDAYALVESPSAGVTRLRGEMDYLQTRVSRGGGGNGQIVSFVVQVEVSGAPVRWTASRFICTTGIGTGGGAVSSISFAGVASLGCSGSMSRSLTPSGILYPGLYSLIITGEVSASGVAGTSYGASEAYFTIDFRP